MMQRSAFFVLTACLAAAVAGCSGSTSAPTPTASTDADSHDAHSHDHEGHAEAEPIDAPAPEPSPDSPLASYLLKAEPEAGVPMNVLDARKDTKDGDDVVLVGRVGGSVSPIVEGRAMFTIADKSFKPCNETGDDGCPTPWDYCCEAGVNKGLATIKIVGEDGKTIAADARDGLGLKELQTVVVKGKAKRDEAGNLTILATGVYVKR